MGSKQRVTIAIDKDIVNEIDRVAKERKESRSHVMEEAVKLRKKRQLEKELIEGCLDMSKEDAETAEVQSTAGMEILQ